MFRASGGLSAIGRPVTLLRMCASGSRCTLTAYVGFRCVRAAGIGAGMEVNKGRSSPRQQVAGVPSGRLRLVWPASVCRAVCLCLAVLCWPAQGSADQLEELARRAGIQILEAGVSSSAVQKSAAAAVPLDRLPAEKRARAAEVMQKCNQFRRLPVLRYAVDQPVYRYLIQHPDVAVSTWRVMEISHFQMWQTGPAEFEAEAVDGSEGIADILYQDEQQTLMICEGSYQHILLPRPLQASAKALVAPPSVSAKTAAAMDSFMKSFGNLNNAVNEVIGAYCRNCAIEMNCVDLARAVAFLANRGVSPWSNEKIMGPSSAKRINALILTCGTYDAAEIGRAHV